MGPTGLVQLLDFNNNNGIISNPITLTYNNNNIMGYGGEFSPSGNYLYLTSQNIINKVMIFQFNVNLSNPVLINKSLKLIASRYSTSGLAFFYALQVAPDGKIYIDYAIITI